MNRLVIIGNGFDLAHGIKSSFKDFISDYLYNAVNEFLEHGSYPACPLLEISYNRNGYPRPLRNLQNVSVENILGTVNYLIKQEKVDFKFNSELLSIAHKKLLELNWVDLETEYFELLIAVKNRGTKN